MKLRDTNESHLAMPLMAVPIVITFNRTTVSTGFELDTLFGSVPGQFNNKTHYVLPGWFPVPDRNPRLFG